ncbi:MAG: long-chain fatty acid--CoA ligase [Bacteroidia bacterium]|nr:long-chain fatty acid--CoA ligase [Bacteroidia bacterium]
MEVTRLFDILPYQREKYPKEVCLAGKVNDKWKTYSTDETIEMVNKVSRGLIGVGVNPGEMVGIISTSRPEWHFADVGIIQTGAVCVPMYPTISPNEFEYIFNHAEIKVVFVGDKKIYDKIVQIKDKVPSLKAIYTFDEIEGSNHFSELIKAGNGVTQQQVEDRKSAVNEKDLATIIYTSGTTGNPKGVMLSHYNILSNLHATAAVLPLESQFKALSFLPLCHIFERMVLYVYTFCGLSVYFCDNMEKIGEYLGEVKPHFFSSVPRLLEKLYEKVIATGNQATGLKKKIFFWAIGLALNYEIDKNQGFLYNAQLNLARKLVFKKITDKLGGNLMGIVTGAAALPSKLCKVFNAMGVKVREGFGQTESSPVISFNRFEPGGTMEGTVGLPISNVQVKIAENGEILAKGPNIMMGYYKNPEVTAETIDADGWLHTGDVGMLVDGKYLKITDRIKELFKTSGGKYIAPQPIETKMKESFFIEQMMVVGENQKFPAALIVPSFPYLKAWCEENNIPYDEKDLKKTLSQPAIQDRYREEVSLYNKEFGSWEQIKKFELIPAEWTIETEELTPTLKLKRRIINVKYKDVIDKIYS